MLQYRDHLWLHQMSWRGWFYFAKICMMYISPIINFWLLNDWGMKNSGPSLKNLFTKNNNYKITPCLQHSLRQSRRKNWNIFSIPTQGIRQGFRIWNTWKWTYSICEIFSIFVSEGSSREEEIIKCRMVDWNWSVSEILRSLQSLLNRDWAESVGLVEVVVQQVGNKHRRLPLTWLRKC